MVFPSPADALVPVPLRNVTSSALLRLADESVRFVRVTALAWTPERLDAVEQRLLDLDGDDPAGPELARRIAYELGIPTLSLADPRLDRVDPAAWDLRRTAVASVARALCQRTGALDPRRAGEEASALEQRFREELEPALAAFVAGLDPQARAVAARHGEFDIGLYNFLVRTPHRAWRLQFVQTFPLLVHAAVTGPRGSGGAHIRALVDAGLPLVKHLAARWAVSPATLRCLLGRSVEHAGKRWQGHPHALARILDALRPEDRPGDDASAWQRLAAAVAIAEDIFHRPVTSSPLTLGWLREAARRGFAQLDEARGGRRLAPEAVALIDRLRAALVAHLTGVAATVRRDAEGELRVAAATVADRQLALMPPVRLGSIARKFALAYAPRRAALDDELRFAEGRVFWPLLPRDFVATATARRVTPLATRADLRQEGVAQDLCIQDGPDLAAMVQACAAGQSYLLSVRHGVSGAPLSTAEIVVAREAGIDARGLRVRQHKARGNARPSAACVAALHEALAWAAGREVQDHLDEGRRRARMRRGATPGSATDMDLAASTEALRIALGGDLHAALERATKELAIARGVVAQAGGDDARS